MSRQQVDEFSCHSREVTPTSLTITKVTI